MTAYFIYLNNNRQSFVNELGEKASAQGAVASHASKKWNALSDAKKKEYQTAAAEAKATYEKAMADFKAQGGEVGKRRAEKRARQDKKAAKIAKKALGMPKRPAGGAYGCYMSENRAAIQSSLPAGSKCTEVSKIGSERWNKLSAKEKEKFEKQYEEKKAAFEEAMKEWKSKQVTEGDNDDEDAEEDAEEDEKQEEDDVLALPTPAKKPRVSASSPKATKNAGGTVPAASQPKGAKRGRPALK